MKLASIPEIKDVTHCGQLLQALCAHVERLYGQELRKMPTDVRRKAIKTLVELGAFELRGSVVRIAKRFGVSRTVIYGVLGES